VPRRSASAGERLSQSLHKFDPLTHPRQAAYLALVRTASDLGCSLAELFRQHGITPSAYNALRVLRGHRPEGLPSQEIGPQLLDRGADVTRLVDRLVKDGLAERKRDAADKRVVRVQITRKGQSLLKKLDKPVMAIHDQQFADFSDQDLNRLLRLLDKARDPADAEEPAAD
jgi:DNA-binding MarR family transcriptional regulator